MGRAGLHAHRARPETRLTPPRRIALLGHVGNQNLGDEAIIAAVIQAIRDRIPNAEITALVSRPQDTQTRHGIPAFPLRRMGPPPATATGTSAPNPSAPDAPPQAAGTGSSTLKDAIRRLPWLYGLLFRARGLVLGLREAGAEASFWTVRYRRMRGTDLLLIAGSNQLSDYVGGPWAFPYTVYSWCVAARLAGARVAFLSVGAGPVRSRLSGLFIRKALASASFCSYRDVGSRDTAQSLGVPGPHRVAPDLAHGLRFDPPAKGPIHSPDTGRTVVVNPLPYFDPRFWAENDPRTYAAYVGLLAAFATKLRGQGHRVRFIPTQLRADPPVIADIVRALGTQGATGEAAVDRVDPPVATFADLLAALAEADVVVATRFHGVVLGQMLGKPTIGIAYRRSTTDLLADVGQGAYAIDIKDLSLAGLLDRFHALTSDGGATERIARRLEEYREALVKQYDEVLGVSAAKG